MSTTTKIAGVVAVVIAALVGFWLLRPLFVDDVVDEAFPAAPAEMSADEVEAEMAEAAEEPDVVMAEDMPDAEPVSLVSGEFSGTSRYDGEGRATVLELSDGSRVLRLEDFRVTNGPDLRVYLAPPGADGQPDPTAPGAIALGPLRGNVGNQNYEIPADADLDGDLAVVIYCEPFSVTFATAPLT